MYCVTLFSDEPVLATGLASVLAPIKGLELTGVFSGLNDLLDAIQSKEPDILLLDFKSEQNFVSLLELRNRVPTCKLVLWVHGITMEVAYHAMRLGVRGILQKTVDLGLLVECLLNVGAGEFWFEHDMAIGFMQAKTINLTPRESQLVTLVSQGLKNKEIATTLSISESTVRIYCSALFRKLGVKDRYELAIYGMKNMQHQQLPAGEILDGHGQARNAEAVPPDKIRFLVLEKPAVARASNSMGVDYPYLAIPRRAGR